jgi:acetylglutamate kinase
MYDDLSQNTENFKKEYEISLKEIENIYKKMDEISRIKNVEIQKTNELIEKKQQTNKENLNLINDCKERQNELNNKIVEIDNQFKNKVLQISKDQHMLDGVKEFIKNYLK